MACQNENKKNVLQNSLNLEAVLFYVGEKTVGGLGSDSPRRRVIIQNGVHDDGLKGLGIIDNVLPC